MQAQMSQTGQSGLVIRKKRNRLPNISHRQHRIMVSYMERHRRLAVGKLDLEFTAAARKETWNHLAAKLNQDGSGPFRTVDQWRKVWNDLKAAARTKHASLQKRLSDSGSAASHLSQLEERIVRLVGPKDAFASLLPLNSETPVELSMEESTHAVEKEPMIPQAPVLPFLLAVQDPLAIPVACATIATTLEDPLALSATCPTIQTADAFTGTEDLYFSSTPSEADEEKPRKLGRAAGRKKILEIILERSEVHQQEKLFIQKEHNTFLLQLEERRQESEEAFRKQVLAIQQQQATALAQLAGSFQQLASVLVNNKQVQF